MVSQPPLLNTLDVLLYHVDTLPAGTKEFSADICTEYTNVRVDFTLETQNGRTYWIQRRPNQFYGLVITSDRKFIFGYPHIGNFSARYYPSSNTSTIFAQEKLNGTNIGIGKVGDEIIIRTRMSPYSSDFPVTAFFNSTINESIYPNTSQKLAAARLHLLENCPFYATAANCEYVGIRTREAVQSLIDVNIITDTYPEYMFFFEMFGAANPIILTPDHDIGKYDTGLEMAIIDIFDTKTRSFLSPLHVQRIARPLNLQVVKTIMAFPPEKIPGATTTLHEYIVSNKIEGVILKQPGADFFAKFKHEEVMHNAHRISSALRGYIYTPDLMNYISRCVSLDTISHPEGYDDLVKVVALEAKTDYAPEIIHRNMDRIEKTIAKQMCIMVADQVIRSDDRPLPDMMRYLNENIPVIFAPMKSYINFNLEKTYDDPVLVNHMRKRRTDIFKTVYSHIKSYYDPKTGRKIPTRPDLQLFKNRYSPQELKTK